MVCDGYTKVWDLAPGELVRLDGARGTTLRVTRGTLWITLRGRHARRRADRRRRLHDRSRRTDARRGAGALDGVRDGAVHIERSAAVRRAATGAARASRGRRDRRSRRTIEPACRTSVAIPGRHRPLDAMPSRRSSKSRSGDELRAAAGVAASSRPQRRTPPALSPWRSVIFAAGFATAGADLHHVAGANLPARISLASGFSICCWIARFSGRAP